jgi:hypothetical protein
MGNVKFPLRIFRRHLINVTKFVPPGDEDGDSGNMRLGHNHFHFLSYKSFISRAAVHILFTY